MIVSYCHNAPVYVVCGPENTSYYVCEACDHHCEAKCSIMIFDNVEMEGEDCVSMP